MLSLVSDLIKLIGAKGAGGAAVVAAYSIQFTLIAYAIGSF